MERLNERLKIAQTALATLFEVLREPKTAITRDASIQRFEYTFEAVWKAAQLFLRVRENLDAASPTSAVRACFRAGVLTDDQARAALEMVRDRNLTVHTYNEELAELIYSRLPAYAGLMELWARAMAAERNAPGEPTL